MDEIKHSKNYLLNNNYIEERKDLAAAFRWAERSNLQLSGILFKETNCSN